MSQRTKSTLLAVAIILVFSILSPLIGATGIELSFGDDILTISGPEEYEYTVAYDKISTMELVTLVDAGTATTGGENRSCRWGCWQNDIWDEYTLCASKRNDTCILITLDDGNHIVLNFEDGDATEELCSKFQELLDDRAES